jgi:hypothetical protein
MERGIILNNFALMPRIILKDICPSYTTNMDAIALDAAVRKALNEGKKVTLSFHNVSGLTSSFLNSSFGAWVDDFGFDTLKAMVVITDYTPYVAAFIKKYLDDLKTLQS